MQENSQENTKLPFRTLKSIRGGKKETIRWIENKDGNLLNRNTATVDRWQKYYKDTLNGKEGRK